MTEEHKIKLKLARERAKEARDNAKTAPETQPSGDKVLIEKSFLEDIRKTIDELKADNAMLKSVADRGRMSEFYQRNKTTVPDQIKLRAIDDRVNDEEVEKIILGWRMVKDDVYIDGPRVIENQIIQLVLEDGSTKELSYRDFVRLYKTVQCSKIGDRTEADGSLIVKLERNDNKKQYEVAIAFVN